MNTRQWQALKTLRFVQENSKVIALRNGNLYFSEREKEFSAHVLNFERLRSPMVQIVMGQAQTSPANDFSIDAWAKFQNMLKNNYLVIKNGNFF